MKQRPAIDWRTVGTVVLLDVATYVLVYWLVMPLLTPALSDLNPGTVLAVAHATSALRLGTVGLLAARARRKRRGLRSRSDLAPTLAVGGLLAFVLQVLASSALVAVAGSAQPVLSEVLINGVEWVAFPLLGLLFVQPGAASTEWRRYERAQSWNEPS